MIKVVLKPLEGIEVEGKGEINFGYTLEEVVSVLGQPEEIEDNQLFYDELELAIDLNCISKKVEFIEIYGPICENIEPSIYGVVPFGKPIKEVMKLLASKNSGRMDDTEAPYVYSYYGSSVGISRDFTEADIKQEIAEAKKNGEYEESMDEEIELGKYIWRIGIGEKDYYKF